MPAPVVEREEHQGKAYKRHIVAKGETLFSIAWRYGMDVRELAAANSLVSPYIIYPGQVLQLATTQKHSSTVSLSQPRNQSVTSKTSSVKRDAPAVSLPPSSSVRQTENDLSLDKNRYPFVWKWPAEGKMLRSYSSSSAIHKGIDIQGNLGEAVRAANSGKVVYAGSGLVGYGKLLIIKHDERYLSAYGHNSKLLAKEGELVKVGQKIAEFGDTGTDRVKLHFQVRRDGKPVDPIKLLPK